MYDRCVKLIYGYPSEMFRKLSVRGVNMLKIDQFVFNVRNGGIDIEVKGEPYRLDPTESAKLLEYLNENDQEILKASRANEKAPAIGGREWYAKKENEAFESMPD